MLRGCLKYQGIVYLPEDLQDALEEDGATSSLIKTGGITNNKDEEVFITLKISQSSNVL